MQSPIWHACKWASSQCLHSTSLLHFPPWNIMQTYSNLKRQEEKSFHLANYYFVICYLFWMCLIFQRSLNILLLLAKRIISINQKYLFLLLDDSWNVLAKFGGLLIDFPAAVLEQGRELGEIWGGLCPLQGSRLGVPGGGAALGVPIGSEWDVSSTAPCQPWRPVDTGSSLGPSVPERLH